MKHKLKKIYCRGQNFITSTRSLTPKADQYLPPERSDTFRSALKLLTAGKGVASGVLLLLPVQSSTRSTRYQPVKCQP